MIRFFRWGLPVIVLLMTVTQLRAAESPLRCAIANDEILCDVYEDNVIISNISFNGGRCRFSNEKLLFKIIGIKFMYGDTFRGIPDGICHVLDVVITVGDTDWTFHR